LGLHPRRASLPQLDEVVHIDVRVSQGPLQRTVGRTGRPFGFDEKVSPEALVSGRGIRLRERTWRHVPREVVPDGRFRF
jgi:hypothetical protein